VRQYEVWATLDAHRRRVDEARAAIRRAAAVGPLVVSSSWGKDSVALCDLAINVLGPVDIMHVRSSYELPGGEHVEAHFRERANVIDVPARLSLQETIAWLRTHGLGHEREKRAGAGKRRKADAALEWVLSRGYASQALGMRAEESPARRTCFRVRGIVYGAHGIVIANPLGWWSTRDVWAYLVSRGLPWHRLYDLETHGFNRESLRNSGWLTWAAAPDNGGRAQWLQAHYPERWRDLTTEFPRLAMLL
jgi:phosphoadenosine phosphosulfate reductase